MPLEAALIALAALAGNTVVTAAVAGAGRRSGRGCAAADGNPDRAKAAERRLEARTNNSPRHAGADLERIRARWRRSG